MNLELQLMVNKSKATSFAVDANGKIIPNKTAGLRMDVISSGNTKPADQLLETQMLNDYKNKHGKLHPGNKTNH
jgi:hypothetical protein